MRERDVGLARLVRDVVEVAVGIGRLVVDRGGIVPRWIASAQTAASTAPAAPSMWPVIDFVEDTATRCATSSPSAALSAAVSAASFSGVEVPWAFT